ncbi:MAG: ATP-dependent DNA helicase RecG [Candidatus Latescibacteria bacterium]|nr:ATP-dependent DNA helicase RecG [Candidatus Latescibacterota bacterium]
MKKNEHASILPTHPVHALPGIGPKRAQVLASVGVETVEDLLYYIPRRYIDRSKILPISQLPMGEEVTVLGRVERFGMRKSAKRGKARFVLTLGDETGFLCCVWFSGTRYMEKLFSVGDLVAVSGKVALYGEKQITHPEFEILSSKGETDLLHTGRVIPLYPSNAELKNAGLDSRGFRRIIKRGLDEVGSSIRDALPETIRRRGDLLPLSEALVAIHFPSASEEGEAARKRLAFDELFAMQVRLAQQRRRRIADPDGIAFPYVGESLAKLLHRLPFDLTEAQKRVMREIRADMKCPRPMNRLLQGDVGSGKTLVALMSMLIAVENGHQAALMAPTEILSEQHFLTTRRLLEKLGARVVLLVGGMKKAQRDRTLKEIAEGTAQIIVGTHALIQADIAFHRLGLVVIDEQHRFGVIQRKMLGEKGRKPDVLVMTATPIPRTLSLTMYGDLDVSILDEMPPGRSPVRTVRRSASNRSGVFQFVRDQVREGRQAYIVYPLVEESEKMDLKAAAESYDALRHGPLTGLRLKLLHGRMKNEEKEATMRAFQAGEVDVLVSTTVIEVGMDAPNATLMIVEHAERFGLTQLHQLRGRVGRGNHLSYCVLITDEHLSDEAKMRLGAMTRTHDGFKIAEIDLELRGPGTFFGTKQSGMPELRIADLVQDTALLQIARREAFALIKDDPSFGEAAHKRIRTVFAKMDRDRMRLMEVR